MNALNLLKSLVENANIVYFDGRIGRYTEFYFNDSSQLLDHLNTLTTLFSDVNSFKFQLTFWSDERLDGYIMGRILNIPKVYLCSNLDITFFCTHYATILPTESISNWLHKNGGKERILSISIRDIHNAREMCDDLKNVKKFAFLF